MAETNIFQPEPFEDMKEIQISENGEKLNTEVIAFSRGEYAIESVRYYHLAADVPWIALIKSVKNQMAAKSFSPLIYEWYEPGLDLIQIYPQGDAAFALAMPNGSVVGTEILIGFYVLKRNN